MYPEDDLDGCPWHTRRVFGHWTHGLDTLVLNLTTIRVNKVTVNLSTAFYVIFGWDYNLQMTGSHRLIQGLLRIYRSLMTVRASQRTSGWMSLSLFTGSSDVGFVSDVCLIWSQFIFTLLFGNVVGGKCNFFTFCSETNHRCGEKTNKYVNEFKTWLMSLQCQK